MAEGVGKKLSGVLTYQNDCAGSIGSADPGKQAAVVTYDEGETISVSWDTTIVHPSAPGVRIAIIFDGNSGFNAGVLASGLESGANGIHSTTVTLPAGKSGDAVIQFNWVSNADGGSYVGCSDVFVTAANNGGGGGGGNSTDEEIGTESSGTSVGTVFFILLLSLSGVYAIGGIGYSYRTKNTL